MSDCQRRDDESMLPGLLAVGIIYYFCFSALVDLLRYSVALSRWLEGRSDTQKRRDGLLAVGMALFVVLALPVVSLLDRFAGPPATQREAETAQELVDNADAGSVQTPYYLAPPGEPGGAELAPAAEADGQAVVQGTNADFRSRVIWDLDAVAKAYCATGPSAAARLAHVRQEDWQLSALLDHPEGLCLAGVCLEYGLWGQTDAKLAMACYRRAAAKGLAPAQVILALHYSAGVGVPGNPTSALEWFRTAAAQGSAEGQLGVGLELVDRGTAAEQIEGARWLRLAAEQGLPAAQCALGVAYTYGMGVLPDTQEARAWYLRAAAQGDRTAAENLAQAEQGAL